MDSTDAALNYNFLCIGLHGVVLS